MLYGTQNFWNAHTNDFNIYLHTVLRSPEMNGSVSAISFHPSECHKFYDPTQDVLTSANLN